MSITAQDIQQQGFEHSLRGYDVQQVDVFLERVAQEVDALVNENKELKEKLENAVVGVDDPTDAFAAIGVSETNARAEEAETRAAEAEANARAAAEQVRAVALQAKAAQDELAAARVKIAQLEDTLAEKDGMDATTISNAFISAQRAADAMVADAQKSADDLREEARAEGERIYRESEAKARDFIREALLEKQRVMDETAALSASCDNFRAQYRALVEHFSAEAERMFSDFNPPVVSEAAVQAVLPMSEPVSPVADQAGDIAEDDIIEEID